MTRRKCELLARGYLGMCSAEEEREDETRQDSHPSNRHAAACACAGMAGDFFLHDRESRRGPPGPSAMAMQERGGGREDDKAKRRIG